MKAVEQFITALKENKIGYDCQKIGDEGAARECVSIRGNGKNFPALAVHFLFDEEGSNSVNIRCFEICKFPENKNLIMLQTVNSLNYTYRWVTFCVSPEGAVWAEMSVAFTDESAQEILMRSMVRVFNLIDVAYPVLMKALYV